VPTAHGLTGEGAHASTNVPSEQVISEAMHAQSPSLSMQQTPPAALLVELSQPPTCVPVIPASAPGIAEQLQSPIPSSMQAYAAQMHIPKVG
jgi:hypothetical protein